MIFFHIVTFLRMEVTTYFHHHACIIYFLTFSSRYFLPINRIYAKISREIMLIPGRLYIYLYLSLILHFNHVTKNRRWHSKSTRYIHDLSCCICSVITGKVCYCSCNLFRCRHSLDWNML